MNAPPWEKLAARHPQELVEAIRSRLELGESFDLSPQKFVADTTHRSEEGRDLLEALVALGLLRRAERLTCVCGAAFAKLEAEEDVCRYCQQAFADIGGPHVQVFYVRDGRQRRDVRWVLVLHGMNTVGAWQEELNWLVSRTYRRSVPVTIYKYGVVRPGAILKFRLRTLTAQLFRRIHRLSRQGGETGFGGVPDVLAHSLGTWLLGHALLHNPTLQVGRVILTGSILRPDFDWSALIDKKQVEAVLCHYGTKDTWAGVAQYVIPDSGPSGRRGFNDGNRIVHFESVGAHHSDFFLEETMPRFYGEVWRPFLTAPTPEVLQSSRGFSKAWCPTFWILRARLMRWAILLIVTAGLIFVLAILGIGSVTLFRASTSLYYKHQSAKGRD